MVQRIAQCSPADARVSVLPVLPFGPGAKKALQVSR
jgi:hypothetical protein